MVGLDRDYLGWLIARFPPFFTERYSILLSELHLIPFMYYIELDKNRAYDGLELRNEYAHEQNIRFSAWLLSQRVSVLEVLVALAGRMDGIVGQEDSTWEFFRELIENLGLSVYTDEFITSESSDSLSDIQFIIDGWMDRRFDDHGNGSIFPLNTLPENVPSMRMLQIWDMMNLYLSERYL